MVILHNAALLEIEASILAEDAHDVLIGVRVPKATLARNARFLATLLDRAREHRPGGILFHVK